MANSCCGLPVQVLVVNLYRGPVAERRVETSPIVEALDVFDNLAAGLCAGRVDGAVEPLILERPEERFGHRVIPADSGPADRGPHLVGVEFGAELDRRVLGGFNWWSQHLDGGGVDGQASGVDEGVDG